MINNHLSSTTPFCTTIEHQPFPIPTGSANWPNEAAGHLRTKSLRESTGADAGGENFKIRDAKNVKQLTILAILSFLIMIL